MTFKLYSLSNKHDDDENWRSNKRKISSIISNACIIFLPTVQPKVKSRQKPHLSLLFQKCIGDLENTFKQCETDFFWLKNFGFEGHRPLLGKAI